MTAPRLTFLNKLYTQFKLYIKYCCRSEWPRGLRRGCGTACLLAGIVNLNPARDMTLSCEHCVLSGRGLCDELISRPEESYRLWCVCVCVWR